MKYRCKLIPFLIGMLCLIASTRLQAQESQMLLPAADSIFVKATERWELSRKQYSYSFKLLGKNVDFSKDGKPSRISSWLTENYFPSMGESNFDFTLPVVLLERNGKPVSADKIEKQRNEVAKQLARLEEMTKGLSGRSSKPKVESEEPSKNSTDTVYNWVVDYFNIYSFTNLHKEMLNGRECYVFLAYPRDGLNSPHLGILAIYDAIYWVDIADEFIVRSEFYEKGQAVKFISKPIDERESAAFIYNRFVSTENGKLWVGEYQKIQYRDKSDKLISTTEFFYSDYKFYKTEVTDSHIDSPVPKKP